MHGASSGCPISMWLSKDLKAMDASAISLARENDIPIVVFSIRRKGGLAAVLAGDGPFTVISD